MAFEIRKANTEGLIFPSGTDREIIELNPGEEVIGILKDFASYIRETEISPDSRFYAVVLEDPETGKEGILSAGAETTFGRQLKNAFGEEVEEGVYRLKPEFEGKKVRIAKLEAVSKSSGQLYYQLGYEILD